ncbi:MAG TPA: ferritin-like domain-containing protein [Acidimicrobiia bacterium]|jgi:ferritin-like protein|nr:ferritin-like domain-containing protein [Acidimicrobiia bacterium]
MAGSSATLHESPEVLGSEAIDRHRAIVSIMEELEAIDWYDQRAIASSDDELRAVLEHNRDDEKEHAAMALEWLRRRDPSLDVQLRKYLFTEGSITAKEDEAAADDAGSGSLGIGDLRTEVTP